jgi:hypothetical protein
MQLAVLCDEVAVCSLSCVLCALSFLTVHQLLLCRLLALTSLAKWLMSCLPTRTACNASSSLITLYALHLPELLTGNNSTPTTAAAAANAQPHSAKSPPPAAAAGESAGSGAALVDLCLLSSTSLASGGLLAEAAQLLLGALLHPAAAGSFPVPELPAMQQQRQQDMATLQQVQAYPPVIDSVQQQQQQQQQQATWVFMPGSSSSAASCWPPAVLQLAVARRHDQLLHEATHNDKPQKQQMLPLDCLPDWLPLLVLSAAAAAKYPHEVPGELLAAVAAGLIDVLLAAAPGPASAIAASWLCQVLRSGAWSTWRPYIGKPAYLMQRWGFQMFSEL